MTTTTSKREPPPWLADVSDPTDYGRLTLTELLDIWNQHRNDLVGAMVGNEICRRIQRGQLVVVSSSP